MVEGIGAFVGSADLVFSSIGWACLTSPSPHVKVKLYTPGGKGISLRTPPILPYCAKFRGARVMGSAAYKVIPLELPARDFHPMTVDDRIDREYHWHKDNDDRNAVEEMDDEEDEEELIETKSF